MKTLFIALLSLCSFVAKSQSTQVGERPSTVTVVSPLNLYFGTGVSIGNGENFKSGSYPSVEIGISKNFYSVGLVLGKSSFEKGSSQFWEIKSAVNKSLGSFNGYLLYGVGSYFGTDKVFIEYGAGVSFPTRPFDLFLQASNWDRGNYVSFGISKNILSFKK